LIGGGKSPQPIDNAREYSLPRLDEQGAFKRRIGLYLARWIGWAACACMPLSHAVVIGQITPAPVTASFAPTALLFALFASFGSFFAYRANRNKSQKGN